MRRQCAEVTGKVTTVQALLIQRRQSVLYQQSENRNRKLLIRGIALLTRRSEQSSSDTLDFEATRELTGQSKRTVR
jgi:hypothetical protein